MQQAAQSAFTNVGNIAGGALMQYGLYNSMMANSPANLYSAPPSGSPYAGAGVSTGSDPRLVGVIPEVG
jgi:hypothetical protein